MAIIVIFLGIDLSTMLVLTAKRDKEGGTHYRISFWRAAASRFCASGSVILGKNVRACCFSGACTSREVCKMI